MNIKHANLSSFFIVFCLAVLGGCQTNEMSSAELKNYINNPDNGLIQTIGNDELEFKLSFKPTALLAHRECCSRKKGGMEAFQGAQIHFEKHTYFSFSLSAGKTEIETYGVGDKSGFGNRIKALSFEMGDHFFAIDSENDTIMLSDYSYSRTYGSAQATNFLIAFEKLSLDGDKPVKIFFQDYIFHTGLKEFTFEQKDLQKVGIIKLMI